MRVCETHIARELPTGEILIPCTNQPCISFSAVLFGSCTYEEAAEDALCVRCTLAAMRKGAA